MAYEVRLARRAVFDLRAIYKHIEGETSDAADLWFRGLESAIFSLETGPSRSPIAPERKDLRHLLYGNKPHIYRILYTIDERARIVYVAQIRHGARRPLASFKPERHS
jgi:plasmid stabilization system protein ParE